MQSGILKVLEGYHETRARFEFDGSLKILWEIISNITKDRDKKHPPKILTHLYQVFRVSG